MSDNIPFEIQTEIIQRIPDTKSLIQFRSVSKAWKFVIDSKEFVAAHTLRHHQAHNHHLLIRTKDFKDCTTNARYSSGHCDECNYTPVKYYSIVDDDETFPHEKVSMFVPDSVHNFSHKPICSIDSIILGSSHGLFCLYDDLGEETDTAVIWNPSIRKSVDIAVPNVLRKPGYMTVVGFGICPSILDPKLVKITFVSDISKLQDVNASTQVEVFNLSSGGTWRSPLSDNLPHISVEFGRSRAVVDGFIYWDAVDRILDDGSINHNLIMSFDLTSEEFTKINLPDPLALNPDAYLSLYNLRESLAVLELKFNRDFNPTEIYHVWQMIGQGCTRSFNKLYFINAPDASIHTTLGFRKSGAPIIEVDNDKEDYYKHERALAIYEPESKSITNIGVYGLRNTFYVHSYMETLLLHGH